MNFEQDTYIVIFVSNSQAITLYKKLIAMKLNVEIMTAPCRLSSSCSKCIKFKGKDFKVITNEIKENNVRTKGTYKLTRNSNNKANYKLIKT